PPAQRRVQLVTVDTGALEMLQRLCPVPSNLMRMSQSAVVRWIVEVVRRQLGGLQYGVDLPAGHHRITLIPEQRGASRMITRGQQMPQSVSWYPPVKTFVGGRLVKGFAFAGS